MQSWTCSKQKVAATQKALASRIYSGTPHSRLEKPQKLFSQKNLRMPNKYTIIHVPKKNLKK